MRITGSMLLGLALVGVTVMPAPAQDYPNHQVNFVVPFAPGGGTDILGRLVGQKLTDRFGNAASVSTEKKRGRGAGDV